MDNETSAQEIKRVEKPLNELLTSSMVHIYVGPENTHWYIHERLLCYYSPFFSEIFYTDDKSGEKANARKNKAYGLPDEEDLSFELLVGWLYSRSIKVPKEEKDLGPVLDLYLLSERLQMEKLSSELVEAVSHFYYQSGTYPALRRVQHIYSNTDDDNEMREMMVGAVAKLLTTSEKLPAHWASALQRNGQLAVDIIRSIQQWKIDDQTIPDARDRSSSRGRSALNGFSAVDRNGTDSMETEKTGATSNMGVESVNSDGDQDQSTQDSQVLKSEESEAKPTPPPHHSTLDSSMQLYFHNQSTPQSKSTSLGKEQNPRPKRPPDPSSPATTALPKSSTATTTPVSPNSILCSPSRPRNASRRFSVTFAEQIHYKTYTYTFYPSPLAASPLPSPSTDKNLDKRSASRKYVAHNELTPPATPKQQDFFHEQKPLQQKEPFQQQEMCQQQEPSKHQAKLQQVEPLQQQEDDHSPAKGLGLDLQLFDPCPPTLVRSVSEPLVMPVTTDEEEQATTKMVEATPGQELRVQGPETLLAKAMTSSAKLVDVPVKPAPPERAKSDDEVLRASTGQLRQLNNSRMGRHWSRKQASPEAVLLGFLWMIYLGWLATGSAVM